MTVHLVAFRIVLSRDWLCKIDGRVLLPPIRKVSSRDSTSVFRSPAEDGNSSSYNCQPNLSVGLTECISIHKHACAKAMPETMLLICFVANTIPTCFDMQLIASRFLAHIVNRVAAIFIVMHVSHHFCRPFEIYIKRVSAIQSSVIHLISCLQ